MLMDLLVYMSSAEHILRMCLELFLAVCIKLLCDNGRIHYKDFINDFVLMFSSQQQGGDGLSREMMMITSTSVSGNLADGFMAERDPERHAEHTQKLSQNAFVISMICFVLFALGSLLIIF